MNVDRENGGSTAPEIGERWRSGRVRGNVISPMLNCLCLHERNSICNKRVVNEGEPNINRKELT